MKLTKEIIRLFKYHGFMTITSPDENIVDHYSTVEELVNAGFINDPEALRMAKLIFDSDGEPVVGPTKEEDVVDSLEPEPGAVPGTVNDPEPDTVKDPEPKSTPESGTVPETVSEHDPVPGEKPETVNESGPTPVTEPGEETVKETETETVKDPEQVKESEPEQTKEKKTTAKTTKRTKKES